MTLVYHGEQSLGACIPLAAQASLQADLGLTGLIAELTAKLQGYLSVTAALTVTVPDLTATIQGAVQVLASLQGQLVPPSATLQLGVVVGLIAALQAQLVGLGVALDLVAELDLLLAAAGIHLWSYTGTSAGLGSELAVATSGGLPGGSPGTQCAAVVLATSVSGPQLHAAFGVST